MRVLLILMMFTVFACSNERDNKTVFSSTKNARTDTIVVKSAITDEIAGSAYRKRADSYFVLIGADTSSFKPVFSEASESGTVSMNLNIPYSKATVSYERRLFELKQILERVTQDYSIDSLKSISYGRLILSGDLAIKLTHEYEKRFGKNKTVTTKQYKEISEFLLSSTLTEDLNCLFKPYDKSVKRIGIEKVFFTTKDELLAYAQIAVDTSSIPERIIDFMTWIELENK